MKTIVGLFDDYASADRAYSTLIERGYDRTDIGVLARDETVRDRLGGRQAATSESALAGAMAGGALGGLTGLLVGAAALAIPGVGPVLAGGALATVLGTTLAGAGLGATAGTIAGALIGMGVPEDEARFYAETVQRGGILVTVLTSDERADEVRAMMRQAGAVDVESRLEEWEYGQRHVGPSKLTDLDKPS
ncbi:MAG: hypothetical protein KatS3mg057_2535 [Herpetosiphonaceae bacterium]|nr:MAG: hypothetical protein KatS3mg057_2535 [Herpetosiphonaceae bacterium]